MNGQDENDLSKSRASAGGTEFAWVSDPDRRAGWLKPRLDDAWGARGETSVGLSNWVPGGFDAYVRVLHPMSRDRPVTGTWAEYEALGEAGEWDRQPEIEEESVSWAEAAAALGRPLASTTRSEEVFGRPYGSDRDAIDEHGWRYNDPAEGSIDRGALAAIAEVLARQTSTPARGVAAVWEGFAGLTSAQGVGWFFAFEETRGPRWWQWLMNRIASRRIEFSERRKQFGARAAIQRLVFPRSSLPEGTGILPKHVAIGPRFSLPDETRDYICFEAGIAEFTGKWWLKAPWVAPDEIEQLEEGFSDEPVDDFAAAVALEMQSPSVIWPDDHVWVVCTEVDFDSTIIACSRACADALLAASDAGASAGAGGVGFEAFEISRDTEDLFHDFEEDEPRND